MEVNFDNVRIQALNDYETIIRRLNNSIAGEEHFIRLNNGRLLNASGFIMIDPDDIREVLNSLRMEIITICLCETSEGSPVEIKSVLPEREIISLIDSD
jgi:aspartate aminotransferase-like enzyme